jgi:predicted AAA+ superfamily ATPase
MVRQLHPWFANVGKRQVKSPKLYFRDSGVLHALLGVHSRAELDVHPYLGASWEGFALECVIRELGLRESECYFWATHAGAELDLFAQHRGRAYGFELKRTDAPKLTPSMRTAVEDLKLRRLFVVVPGTQVYSLHERVTVMGLGVIDKRLQSMLR